MYNIEPIDQIDFDGILELILIFDDKDVLQATQAVFKKEKFNDLLIGLDAKYSMFYKNIPYVGDKSAKFSAINGLIFLESVHLSTHTILNFSTNEFEALRLNKINDEQLQKKKKEESML
tara:strand:+ start:50 stop:406 length:357 start_codon:yes stop_codon:yes gene_type:complete